MILALLSAIGAAVVLLAHSTVARRRIDLADELSAGFDELIEDEALEKAA